MKKIKFTKKEREFLIDSLKSKDRDIQFLALKYINTSPVFKHYLNSKIYFTWFWSRNSKIRIKQFIEAQLNNFNSIKQINNRSLTIKISIAVYDTEDYVSLRRWIWHHS